MPPTSPYRLCLFLKCASIIFFPRQYQVVPLKTERVITNEGAELYLFRNLNQAVEAEGISLSDH